MHICTAHMCIHSFYMYVVHNNCSIFILDLHQAEWNIVCTDCFNVECLVCSTSSYVNLTMYWSEAHTSNLQCMHIPVVQFIKSIALRSLFTVLCTACSHLGMTMCWSEAACLPPHWLIISCRCLRTIPGGGSWEVDTCVVPLHCLYTGGSYRASVLRWHMCVPRHCLWSRVVPLSLTKLTDNWWVIQSLCHT